MSLTVQVQYRSTAWQVEVPKSTVEHGDINAVVEIVRRAAPTGVDLPSRLRLATLTDAPWTHRNIASLALPNKNYIWLKEHVVHEHLHSLVYVICEYFDNSLSALSGCNNPGDRAIEACLCLAKPQNPAGKQFVAILDLGSGMSEEGLEGWACIRTAPDSAAASQLAGDTPYYADGILNKFGEGSKYAGFALGSQIQVITSPRDDQASQSQLQVYEMCLNKDRIDQANAQSGDAFDHPYTVRTPETYRNCRQSWELQTPELMELYEKIKEKRNFTLFVISDLRDDAVQQLLELPFSTLVKAWKGMYFYFSCRGATASNQPPRASFMHNKDFKDGPVQILVNGTGFKDGSGQHISSVQSHSLESIPYPTWPEDPAEGGEAEFEDPLHVLARHTQFTCFDSPLKGVPEVRGSKFCFGIIIPGGSHKAVRQDVSVMVYLHYLPIRKGRDTRKDLGLKNNARWFAHWKGKLVVMADNKAQLPFMRKLRDKDETGLWKRANEQVVGQLFFPGIATVDTYKLQFTEAIDELLHDLPDSYFEVDEDMLYGSTGTRLPSGFARSTPGVKPIPLKRIRDHFKIWVKECSRFDEKWEMDLITSQPESELTVFKKLISLREPRTTYEVGTHVLVPNLGNMMSVSKDSDGHVEQRNRFFGAVVQFEKPKAGSLADTVAVLSREPEELFGHSLFRFPIFRLCEATDQQYTAEVAKERACVPSDISVMFADAVSHGPAVRPRTVSPAEVVQVTARTPMKQAVVKVLTGGHSSTRGSRSGAAPHSIVHWTYATERTPGGWRPLVVQHIVKHADGPKQGKEAFKPVTLELCQQADGSEAFVFNKDRSSFQELPLPGRYHGHFTATMANAGGVQYDKVVKSQTYNYHAVHSTPTQMQLLDFPARASFGESLVPVHIEVKDKFNNTCSAAIQSIEFCSQKVLFETGSNKWVTSDGAQRLEIQDIVLRPKDSFSFAAADAVVDVEAQVVLDFGKGDQITKDFTFSCCPGRPTSMKLHWDQPSYSLPESSPTAAVDNRSAAPTLQIQLLDIMGYATTPQGDTIRADISLLAANPGAEIKNGSTAVSSSSGQAVFSQLCVCLLNLKQATEQQLQVCISGLPHTIKSQILKILMRPCSHPQSIQLFRDLQCTQAFHRDGEAFVLQQPAGEKVMPFFAKLENEAENLRELPADMTFTLNKSPAGCEETEIPTVIMIKPGSLKAPVSLNSYQDVSMTISGPGSTWACSAILKLTAVAGPAQQWALQDCSRTQGQRRSELIVKNGQSLRDLLTVWPTDKRHHPCSSLPNGVQMGTNPPELTLTRLQHNGEQGQSVEFLTAGKATNNVYKGTWSLRSNSNPSQGLQIDNAAIVGPPGTVLLEVSGGTADGKYVQSGQLKLQLTLGELAGLQVDNWPSGPQAQPLSFAVRDMTLIPHDIGNNVLSLTDGMTAVIEPCKGSGATVKPDKQGPKTLAITAAGSHLEVAPFSVSTQVAGEHHFQLKLRSIRDARDLVVWPLPPVTMQPSARVVASIEADQPADIIAGDYLPEISFQLKMQDGSYAQNTAGFLSCLKADYTAGTSASPVATISRCQDHATRFWCSLSQQQTCTVVTTCQVVVTYTALETQLGQTVSFQVLAAAPAVPHLPAHVTADRSCINIGEPALRTILPAAHLVLHDRFGNKAHLLSPQKVFLKLVDPSRPEYQGSEIPQLDASTLGNITVQPSAADTDIGPVCVADGTGHMFGNYCLEIHVESVSQPLEVVFTFTDASQWTQEYRNAMLRLEEAERQLNACTKEATRQQKISETLSTQIVTKLASAQTASLQDVDLGNWQNVQQEFSARLQQLPMPRAAKSSQLVTDAEKQYLLQIPGVLGFVYNFFGVADETDAKLLSWYAQSRLSWLVVSTWDAKLAVEEIWMQQWKKWSQLTVLPLDRAYHVSEDMLQEPLPHAGTSAGQAGRPMYFHNLVTFKQTPLQQPSSQQRLQVLQTVCNDALRMDTEAEASQYRGILVEHNKSCPAILTVDKGSLLQPGGAVAIGAGANAPATIAGLQVCFGGPDRDQTAEYQTVHAVISALQGMDDLLLQQSMAQGALNEATAQLPALQVEVERAQEAVHQAAEKLKAAQLQPAARAPAQTRSQKRKAQQHDATQGPSSSPQTRQQRRQRTGPQPRGLFQGA